MAVSLTSLSCRRPNVFPIFSWLIFSWLIFSCLVFCWLKPLPRGAIKEMHILRIDRERQRIARRTHAFRRHAGDARRAAEVGLHHRVRAERLDHAGLRRDLGLTRLARRNEMFRPHA